MLIGRNARQRKRERHGTLKARLLSTLPETRSDIPEPTPDSPEKASPATSGRALYALRRNIEENCKNTMRRWRQSDIPARPLPFGLPAPSERPPPGQHPEPGHGVIGALTPPAGAAAAPG
jgi:hypothetical protein